ncbi:hypothetical protein E1161_24325 [Saccharopolyspora aridisoli]|uniref:Uncharacterized protein n=1 Tax=Saccharopolyspora aridisoli TaxID=2530385 RepID=A0A4V2Y6G4_9PSEU|nr:hypothetical protein [Saccharopolyspora aridisoli]TDC88125.1 hypothetical protein E1161_24325 [Saccharopolyspora aridisoli]
MTTSSSEPPAAVPTTWSPPQPNKLPGLRESLADSMRNPFQHQVLVRNLAGQRGTMRSLTGDFNKDAADLLKQERDRLFAAELFYISADMTRLALASVETLPVHNLHPEDVPSEYGFMVFAEPIGAYLPEPDPRFPAAANDVVTIVAASWGPLAGVVPGDPGVWITFWSATDLSVEVPLVMKHRGMDQEEAEAFIRRRRAELNWDNEVITRFGAVGVQIFEHTDKGTVVHKHEFEGSRADWQQVKATTIAWSQVVRATWLLITQPGVTSVDEHPLPRNIRRRAAREGYNPNAVRVVRIRDRADTPVSEGAGRNYQVRWTVRGHWRNQWYASREEHRPVWINPHVKGPADAPLRNGQTVHLVDSED